MTKKIGLGLVALVAMTAGVVGLSAFEAHVINVTAQIENALQIATKVIPFGTVFPQEELDREFRIQLSDSFVRADRVDDVEYIIRQKPKCGVTSEDGEVLDGPTWTGHVVVTQVLDESGQVIGYTSSIDCEQDRPKEVDPSPAGDLDFYLLPSLCEYLSKHEITEDGQETNNDKKDVPAFHKPWVIDANGNIVWNEAEGRLAKSAPDFFDIWNIDLKVPCFGDHCAQDWDKFVTDINPSASSTQYIQPIGNEHKIFGCNLWIEVTEVSEFGTLTVTKMIEDITGVPFTDFSFTVDGGADTAFEADGSNDVVVSAGAHTVVEVFDPDYTTVVDCGGGAGDTSVVVPAGGSASCTITNTFDEGI